MTEPNYGIKYKKGDFEVELRGDKAWVEAKFKELTTTEIVKPSPTILPQISAPTTNLMSFPESLAEFVKSKGGPKKHNVLVVVFAYWLYHKQKQQSFNARDIGKCYDEVRIKESSNTSQYLNGAQGSGFFKRQEERKDNQVAWTITQSGDKFVDEEQWKLGDEEKEQTGKSKAGGSRSNIISKAVDGLVEEGWLNKAKTASEVSKELERKTVPGVTLKSVGEALRRRARSGVLDRIKGKGKEYAYIKKTP